MTLRRRGRKYCLLVAYLADRGDGDSLGCPWQETARCVDSISLCTRSMKGDTCVEQETEERSRRG